MFSHRPSLPILALCLALAAIASPATADEIYGTGEGCGGFSCFGFDVSAQQSQAVRFVPTSDYVLDELALWFMNNDFSGTNFGEVVLTIEGDSTVADCSTPDGVALDEMRFQITAVGWDPVLERVASVNRPALEEGEAYWVVAKSDAQPLENPVWVAADGFTGFMAASVFDSPDVWQCGGSGAVSGLHVEGTRTGSDYQLTVPTLVAGQQVTLAVTGATPNTTTYFAFAGAPGETFVPQLNVTLELESPRAPLAPITTDGAGNGEVTFTVPEAAAGKTLWIQSAQFDQRSDLVEAPVQ